MWRRKPPPPRDPRGPPLRFQPGFAALLFVWSAAFLPGRSPLFTGAFLLHAGLLAAGSLRIRPRRYKESDFRLFFFPVFLLAVGYAMLAPFAAGPLPTGRSGGGLRVVGTPLGLFALLVVPVFAILLERFATRTRLLVAGAVLPWALAVPFAIAAVIW